jgi:hypothetical protein
MSCLIVDFIVIKEGEFLYDKNSQCVYNCTPPHKYVGKIDLNSFKIIKTDILDKFTQTFKSIAEE